MTDKILSADGLAMFAAVMRERPRDKFKTKRGDLTAYALACGYIQRKEHGTISVELWHEGACYHVRCHDHGLTNGRRFWLSFESLTKAREHFRCWRKIAACLAHV